MDNQTIVQIIREAIELQHGSIDWTRELTDEEVMEYYERYENNLEVISKLNLTCHSELVSESRKMLK